MIAYDIIPFFQKFPGCPSNFVEYLMGRRPCSVSIEANRFNPDLVANSIESKREEDGNVKPVTTQVLQMFGMF